MTVTSEDLVNLREVIKAAKKNPPIQASLQNLLRAAIAYDDLEKEHARRALLMHRYCDAVDNGRIKRTLTYATFCKELQRPQMQQPATIDERPRGNGHASGSI